MPQPHTPHHQQPSRPLYNLSKASLTALLVAASLLGVVQFQSSRRVSAKNKISNVAVNPIRQISVLGERNSGTRWTYGHLNDCFGHKLKVVKNLTRYKHWFQYPDPTRYEHDTLVIAQFRNPYDWLKAMERVPHHSPNHMRTKEGANASSHESENDWRIFLTKEWTMERVGKDLELTGNETCQENFKYRDIVSCVVEPLPHEHYNVTIRYSEHQPFYEMRNDGSGKPYANILELRSDKIRNFLSVRKYPNVADVWVTQYEYLLDKGTLGLIRHIQEWTGVEPRCKAFPPQVRATKNTRIITPDFAQHVREHLNWTVEAMVGYQIEWTYENAQ
ncbi:hypothetical protein ACA910_003000 [Epithemia clementina (nom. ined.)]